MPSHYLKQWLNIVNWTIGNKLQWNLSRKLYFFIQKMHLKMSSGNWRPFCRGLGVLICFRLGRAGCGNMENLPVIYTAQKWWRHDMDTFSALLTLWEYVDSFHKEWGTKMLSLIMASTSFWTDHRVVRDLRISNCGQVYVGLFRHQSRFPEMWVQDILRMNFRPLTLREPVVFSVEILNINRETLAWNFVGSLLVYLF